MVKIGLTPATNSLNMRNLGKDNFREPPSSRPPHPKNKASHRRGGRGGRK